MRCKYLTSSLNQKTGEAGSDYGCAKAIFMGRQLDYHQGHEGFEGNGNCSGTLGFIIENQGVLMGNATAYHENGEDTQGIFRGITLDEGIVSVGDFNIPERFVGINVQSEKIVFTTPNNRISEMVYFDKPQEPKA